MPVSVYQSVKWDNTEDCSTIKVFHNQTDIIREFTAPLSGEVITHSGRVV